MNSIHIILLLCAASTVKCLSLFNRVSPEADVDQTADLGKFISIEKGVKIKENVKVHSYVTVKEDTTVGKNSDLGKYSTIGSNTVLENDVVIEEYATIGKQNTIAPESVVSKYATTKDNVKIGKKAQIQRYATVGDDTEIGQDAILNRYSTTMKKVKIHPKAYVGEYAHVEQNAVVDELAVVHKYVEIPEGTTVRRNQVVIRTPSSYELYKTSDPTENIPNELVTLAATQGNSDIVSIEFNNMMREKLDAQLNELKTKCDQKNNKPLPENLRHILSLYLIGYNGLNSFNENLKTVNGGILSRVANNFRSGCSPVQQLEQEFHFGSHPKRTILTPEVQKKMVQLLAIIQDEERDHRVADDTVCSMIAQIQRGDRDVTCADIRSTENRC